MELRTETTTETITGIYMDAVMRDYQTGYTVFRINTGTEIMICVGYIIPPTEGMKVEVTGVWKNGKYGKQLTDCSLNEILTDKSSMTEFLSNINGIGRKTAEELVECFGERVYEVAMSSDAVRKLKSVPSISDKRAESIIEHIKKTNELRKLFEIITKHGGTYNAAYRIFRDYGQYSVSRFIESPYTIGTKAGLSFNVCDSVAKEFHVNPYSRIRVLAAVTQILKKEATAGHTYLSYPELMKQTRKILGVTKYDEAIATACINATLLAENETLHKENDAVYLNYLFYEETRAAYAVKRLVRYAQPVTYDVEKLIAYAEEKCGVKYADQQKEAFQLLLNGGLGIVTGGPGTGKTTVIKGLLAAYSMLFPNAVIKLCAPTGRASQRMKEATGREATTIHRILEYKPYGDVVTCKNESDPIEADFLFVDEASMISIDLADILFSAIRSGTTVILAGDIDQLPAVGAGNVLHDLIESGIVPTVQLTKTYRQAGDSLIIENAKRIRQGSFHLKTNEDFIIIEADDSEIPNIVKEQFLQYNDANDPFYAQVLTPARRKRETASNTLSKTLQSAVNKSENCLRYGDTAFRVSDKVMFMRNNYSEGYYNGDVGIIQYISGNLMGIEVDGNLIEINEELLDDLSLAYACTIHKSQGSEYQTAIVVLPSDPVTMLQRNLFYTAITRAKKRVVVIAAEGTIKRSIMKKDALKRNSKLVERLRG